VTIREAGKRLRSREISVVELVEQALQDVERDDELNAFLTVTGEQALESARLLDRELRNGRDLGPLHGIPIAFKDLYHTQGLRSTNGSKLFEDFVPEDDATVVQKLRAAGAISVGNSISTNWLTASPRIIPGLGRSEIRGGLNVLPAVRAAAPESLWQREPCSAEWGAILADRFGIQRHSAEPSG
jgi:aspartyl-tRNA(Asn)/glutamyl-tRNA(Gln) amidotransferase subunit A